jgi:hypothetical protein
MVGIVGRNDPSNDRCNILGPEVEVALAPKGLDLFQSFLRYSVPRSLSTRQSFTSWAS